MSYCEEHPDCLYLSAGMAACIYLFCLFTTLIAISAFKYKNYGFTFKLLVTLDLGAVFFLVYYSLDLSFDLKVA